MRKHWVATLLGLALSSAAACSTPRETTPSLIAEQSGLPSSPASTTTRADTPTPKPTEAPKPPCTLTTGACVSLSGKQAWLLRDGRLVLGPVQVEPGGPEQLTPAGTFRVAWKDRVHRSSVYGTDMPNSVFFAPGGIAFHAGSLTSPSHGCVHLSDADSVTFFDGLNVGDAVEVVA